jgi:hypothetical protein
LLHLLLHKSFRCLAPSPCIAPSPAKPAIPCRCNSGSGSKACTAHEQAPAHTTSNILQQVSTPTIQPGKPPESTFLISCSNYQQTKPKNTQLLALTYSTSCIRKKDRITKHSTISHTLDTHPRKTLLPNAEVRDSPKSTRKIVLHIQIVPVSLQQMAQWRHNSDAERMDIEDSNSPSHQHKRSATTDLTVDHRKNKGTKTTHGYEPKAHHLWYGFPIMEAIAATEGSTPEVIRLQIPDLVELGWLENEALDYHNGKIAFPRVIQHF